MNKKGYKPKEVTTDLIDRYNSQQLSLCKIARMLKRDATSVRNEMKNKGVIIRKVGSKRNPTNFAAGGLVKLTR